jgi:hypothetical protein
MANLLLLTAAAAPLTRMTVKLANGRTAGGGREKGQMSLSPLVADALFAFTCLPLVFAAALTLARLLFMIVYLPVHFALNRRDVAFESRHRAVVLLYHVIAWTIIGLGIFGAIVSALG